MKNILDHALIRNIKLTLYIHIQSLTKKINAPKSKYVHHNVIVIYVSDYSSRVKGCKVYWKLNGGSISTLLELLVWILDEIWLSMEGPTEQLVL